MYESPPPLAFMVSLRSIKKEVPIQPIVSFLHSPTYKLCKYLNNWFTCNSNFRPTYSIKTSLDLIERIKDFDIPPNTFHLTSQACTLASC